MKNFYVSVIGILFSIALFGQSSSEIRGKVLCATDSSALIGASVYIAELRLGSFTDENGIFIIPHVSKGGYLLQVSYLGYSSQTAEVNTKDLNEVTFYLKDFGSTLNEVVVTGVSSATEQQTNPIPVSTLSQKEILQSSSTNVIDAMSRIPGVTQITQGPAISKPVVRGLGYNRVVVMNDGVRQEGQQWGDEFGIEIDPYTVDRVEVLKGPASLSYGSDAMAGVINMLSAPTLPEGKIKGTISTNYQTNNGMEAVSTNLAGNNKGITWDARYTNINAHAYQNKYDGYVFNSGFAQDNFKGSLGINRKWGYSRVILSSFDMRLGIIEGGRDSATGAFNRHVVSSEGEDSTVNLTDDELRKYKYDQIIHQRVRHHKVVWDNSFSIGQGKLKLTLGLQKNYRQEANDATIGNVYNNSFYLNTINYNLQYILPEINMLEVSVGINGMKQSSDNRGTVFLVPEYKLFDFGAFALAKKTFNKLALCGGLRYQSRTLQGDNLYLDSSGNKLNNDRTDAIHRFTAYNSSFTGMVGSLGGTYEITRFLYAKANVSRGFRAPNIAESGSDGVHDGTVFYEIGDPNLKPEISTQLDATLGTSTKNFTAEVSVFQNMIENYIFPEKLSSQSSGDSIREDHFSGIGPSPAFKYVSGNVVLSGGEFVLNIHPKSIKWIRWENSFSFVNAIQKNQPDSSKYLPYTPPYKLISQLTISLGNTGSIVKNFYLKGGFDYYFKQDKVFHKFGNETVTPYYLLLNAGAGFDVCSKTRTLFSFYLFASNLSDVAYQSNMSRLKYTDVNNVTGRTGVYNMGRNVSFKLIIPLDIKN